NPHANPSSRADLPDTAGPLGCNMDRGSRLNRLCAVFPPAGSSRGTQTRVRSRERKLGAPATPWAASADATGSSLAVPFAVFHWVTGNQQSLITNHHASITDRQSSIIASVRVFSHHCGAIEDVALHLPF